MTDRRPPRVFDVPGDAGAMPGEPASRAEGGPRRPRAMAASAVAFEDDAFLALEPDADDADVAIGGSAGRVSWGAVAAAALGGLVSIAVGLWIERLVSDILASSPILGIVAVVLTALLVIALLVLVGRELWGLRSLTSHVALRLKARDAIASHDNGAASAVVAELGTMLGDDPATARGRVRLAEVARDVIDPADRLALAERELLGPLDAKARAVVLGAAKRVSVVTAVAPRALIDIAFVVLQTARTVRAVAGIYGVRPGRLGFLRLLRATIGHLAVTGTIAVGDSILGEAVGHSIASRLSARFGEGIVNGLLTARVGIAAMDLCRPLPFEALPRPTIGAMARELVAGSSREPSEKRAR